MCSTRVRPRLRRDCAGACPREQAAPEPDPEPTSDGIRCAVGRRRRGRRSRAVRTSGTSVFHAVPNLPEQLVSGRQAVYFDFFYDRLSATPDGVSRAQRAAYADAYARPDALHAGFEWDRAFEQDDQDNARDRGQPVDIPVLYLHGEKEPGIDLARYVTGMREAGLRRVRGDVIRDCGHFAPDERPDDVAAALRTFIADG